MKRTVCALAMFFVVAIVGLLSTSFAQETPAVAEKFRGFYGESGIWVGQMVSDNARTTERYDVVFVIKEIDKDGRVKATRQIGRSKEEVVGTASDDGVIKISDDWQLTLKASQLTGTAWGAKGRGVTYTVTLTQKRT
jgi:hypothetical protein